ncbi:McbB family protein [Paenibacillus polymyxa]|uniref:McbB family protein n=1 Tax=Paenibacillus polymyxa TaxID=1406 RepID=UPI001BEB9850|nr:McbB family protein [Paenibacillus polymyxa]MBT2285403.1 McbB family protein [Paenibacillus polymyxa]
MSYRISKYIMFQVENGDIVIQNQESILKVSDNLMKQVISKWDLEQKENVSNEELEELFGDLAEEAIEFLMQYYILTPMKIKTVTVEKIVIASNDIETGKAIHRYLSEEYHSQIPVEVYDLDSLPLSDQNELTVVFMSPYSKKKGKEIVLRQDKQTNSKLLFSYVYHGNFYMDCLYSPQWKVPCHLCHIGHIESSGLVEDTDQDMTYQNMIDLIYKENEAFEIQMPLSGVQKLNITSNLVNKIREYIGDFSVTKAHREDITTCTLVDLQNFKKIRDTSLHWELCNCYE